MIRIKRPQLEEWAKSLYDDFFVKEGYKNILESYMQETYWNEVQKKKLHYLFQRSEDIISGRPSELKEIIRFINCNFPIEEIYNIQINPNNKKCKFKDALNKVFNYDDFIRQYNISKWGAYTLTTKLKVNVCPYCNRQFTTTYQSDDGRTRPQLDHFFNKATYPYLAVSFFNLIPSCYVCNANLKGSEAFSLETHIHPYEEGFEHYKTFTIKFDEGTNIDYVSIFEGNQNGFSIDFKDNILIDKEDPILLKINNNCKTFKLIELYNTHKDYAVDLMMKSKIYNDEQIKSLLISFPDLFQSESEVIRLVLGTMSNSEWGSSDRVLSKFTQDISIELKELSNI